MQQNYKIKSQKDGSFEGSQGELIQYYWVKAEREQDGITIEFGSKVNYEKQVGEVVSLDIEKTEKANGKFSYKLVD